MKKTPAAEQFAALGIAKDDWTDAMRLAVKQKWSGLPVDAKVADLRALLDAATATPLDVPSVEDIKKQMILDGAVIAADAEAIKEHKRLKRNAAVNAWRERNQIQAALDARDLKFAALRAKRKAKTSAAAPASTVVSALAS